MEEERENYQPGRALGIINKIPEVAQKSALEGQFEASIMELDNRDKGEYFHGRIEALCYEDLRGAAKLVFDWCKEQGLEPKIYYSLSPSAYDDHSNTHQITISWA